MNYFLIFWIASSTIAVGLFVHFLIVISAPHSKERFYPHYGLGKTVIDLILIILFPWIAIPLLLSTLNYLKNRPSSLWTQTLVVYIALAFVSVYRAFKAFKRGKIYA